MLNVGIIGLGVGERHIAGYKKHPECRVIKICDLDKEKLKTCSKKYNDISITTSAKEILTDKSIDVVSIASYDFDHCDQILLGLENKKHLFVEKPICTNFLELDSITLALNQNPDIKFSSNLILRKSQRFIDLREQVKKGNFGDLYYLEGDYDYGRVKKILSGWRATMDSYSIMNGGGIHLIDLILWIHNKRVSEVFGYGNKIITNNKNNLKNDFVSALLRFEDKSCAKITANFGSVTKHHHKVCVYGSKKTFVQSHTGAAYFNNRDENSEVALLNDDYPGTSKGDMLYQFINNILYNSGQEVSSQEVIDSMTVSLFVEKSVMSGNPERVKYINLDNRND